jgi:transcriptional regulator with XRE-family HTH domain
MKKTMNKIPEYNSPLMEEIYQNIPQTTFDFVASRMALASRINEAIKMRGWSQKQFAEAMNKKPSEISKWLSGTHNFTTDTLWHIEQVLGIHLLVESETSQNSVLDTDSIKKFILQEVNKTLEKYLKPKQVVLV